MYHGPDFLYLFMSLDNKPEDSERKMSRDLASAWVLFAWGQNSWPSGSGHTGVWKIWGLDSGEKVETEEEGEKIKSYSRFNRLLQLGSGGLWQKYRTGLSYLLMKRGNLGKFIADTQDHDNPAE